MKYFYFLITILFFCSCKPERHLYGIWIGSHEAHYNQSNIFPNYSSLRYLLEFEEDSYTIKVFDFPIYGEREYQETHPYNEDGFILLKDLIGGYEYDTLEIKSISSNRLVLKAFVDYRREFVFEKIEQEKSPSNFDLLERTFVLKGKNKNGKLFIDSLDFVNDSILFHLGSINKLRYTYWAINQYKDLSFLLINNIDGIPLLIKERNGNDLILSSYERSFGDFELNEIKYSNKLDKLYGSWVEQTRLLNGEIDDPPPPLGMNKKDQKIKLTIKKDSLTIDQYKRCNSFYWEANSTNELIFIPGLNHHTHHAIWKIKEASEDTLIIDRIEKFSFSNEIETIIFNKKSR